MGISTMREHKFSFERGRGLVWVCDIQGSSKLLNNNTTAAAMEEFLPRFHWVAREAVEALGGKFIKWTGDGFLAWFPFSLHREIGYLSASVFNMIWYLTLIHNVTGLGVEFKKKIRLRHGVTIEHDALITHISDNDTETIDLIGRAVVFAFRISGIKAVFPGVVTQKELVDAALEDGFNSIHFRNVVGKCRRPAKIL